jgi:hypothetical protein
MSELEKGVSGVLVPDPLGLQPEDASPILKDLAIYNHKVRSFLFGGETEYQREVRVQMFGEDLKSGVMGDLGRADYQLQRIEKARGEDRAGFESLGGEGVLEALRENLAGSNREKLRLVREYNQAPKEVERCFAPQRQVWANCVPFSLHEVGRRAIGDDWPYRSRRQTKRAFGRFTGGDWQNPSKIRSFVRSLGQEEGAPVGARSCLEPLTLTAGLRAGGMAVAKHQDQGHVLIIEDFERKPDGDLAFVLGDALGGAVRKGASLEEIDRLFFRPDQRVAVTLVLPMEGVF